MDRPPEDPAPGDPAPEDPTPDDPAPDDPAPDDPAPDHPAPDDPARDDPAPADSATASEPRDTPTTEPPPPVPPVARSPYGPGAYAQYAAPAPGALPSGSSPREAERTGPGSGAGVATGCGLQVLAFLLFSVSGGLMFGFLGALWPFTLVTVGSALLMMSKRWRRFATGALIVSAATWIVVIGPCIALLSGTF